MVELAVVESDDRLVEGDSIASVEGGVPRTVFVAEADDDVGAGADEGLRANRVDARPLWSRQKDLRSSPASRWKCTRSV
jgi:hypothetical protein